MLGPIHLRPVDKTNNAEISNAGHEDTMLRIRIVRMQEANATTVEQVARPSPSTAGCAAWSGEPSMQGTLQRFHSRGSWGIGVFERFFGWFWGGSRRGCF